MSARAVPVRPLRLRVAIVLAVALSGAAPAAIVAAQEPLQVQRQKQQQERQREQERQQEWQQEQEQQPLMATLVTPRTLPFDIRLHAQFGRLWQTAHDSFSAVLGSSSGQVFGGGAELTFRNGLFARGAVSSFGADGERVELDEDGQPIALGIPLSLSLMPVDISGGYRLPAIRFGRRRGGGPALIPFVGAGAGFVRYHEETDDAHPEETVNERVGSYHVLVGVDLALGSRVTIGAEFTRRWVPNGLGSGGISQALGETDLGGSTLLARIGVILH